MAARFAPVLMLLLFPTLLFAREPGARSAARSLESVPEDAFWTTRTPRPGMIESGNYAGAAAVFNTELHLGGDYNEIDGHPVHHLARWDGASWQSVGGGVANGPIGTPNDGAVIYSLTVFEEKLIVAGSFTHAGGLAFGNIAAWDGSSWSALGPGFPGGVACVEVIDGVLHATTSAGVRRWVSGSWVPLGTNLTGAGAALVKIGPNLYTVGSGLKVGTTNCGVAWWNGTTWAVLATTDWHTTDAVAYQGDLVISGWFNQVNGMTARGVARWNGTTWSTIGGGIQDNFVEALAVYHDRLIALGWFWSYSTEPMNGTAQWDGTTWSALGSGTDLEAICSASVEYNGELCVLGDFYRAGEAAVWDIGLWNGTSWRALRRTNSLAIGGSVEFLVPAGAGLLAGGWFDVAGDTVAHNVAVLAGDQWCPFGDGLNATVWALAAHGSTVWAGGEFTMAGDVAAAHVAEWSGGAWSAMGDGLNGVVGALVPWQGGVVAGGEFTATGATPLSHIGFWDGTAWQPIGSGINNTVLSLTVHNGQLVAGGSFSQAGGLPAARIARWDGAAWHALGSGASGRVNALHSRGSDLFAAGSFSTIGGVSSVCIGRWDGTAWNSMAGGLTTNQLYWGPVVYALTEHAGQIVAVGAFSTGSGRALHSVGGWDGSEWHPFGSGAATPNNAGLPGPEEGVHSACSHAGSLFIGGEFYAVGGKQVLGVAEWRDPSTVAVPDKAGAPRVVPIRASPNPFRSGTEIAFRVDRPGLLKLTVHDVTGRRVSTLLDEDVSEGTHRLRWNARGENDAPIVAGVYFLQMTSGTETHAIRFVYLGE